MENSETIIVLEKSKQATKWAIITELFAKLAVPVTNMILARILVPEVFGLVVTVTLVVSFAEILADSGFQKYLIQNDFTDDNELNDYANVAFVSNLVFSLVLFFVITIFSNSIAIIVGSEGHGSLIIIASTQLPISAISSIGISIAKRKFDFKKLFYSRTITVIIPFVVTIPMALLGFGYWSLLIGSIVVQLTNALFFTIKSNWKFKLFYSFSKLKKMLAFSFWTLLESITIWLTTWIDIFLISSMFSNTEVGLYRTSTSMTNSVFSLFTAMTIPVLFATLSRLKNDHHEFLTVFLKYQKYISVFVLPLGVAFYFYGDIVTKILLGENWLEATNIVSIWGLTTSLMIVFGHFASEVYRAKGKPRLSFVAQLSHLFFLVPVIIITSKYSFEKLVFYRSIMRIQFVFIHLLLLQYVFKIPIRKMIYNLKDVISSTIVLILYIFIFYKHAVFINNVKFAISSSVVYLLSLIMFSKDIRMIVYLNMNKLIEKRKKK